MMYDWDNLDVDYTMQDSKMFFAERHSRHEAVKIENPNEDEFVQVIEKLVLTTDNETCIIKEEVLTPIEFKKGENDEIKSEDKENELAPQTLTTKTAKGTKPAKLNLVTPSKFGSKGAVPKRISPKPAVTERVMAVPKKREILLQKQIEEEKKMREFRSRPMPVFKMPQLIRTHVVTTPFTPEVVKRSKESYKKRLEKLKQIEESQKPIQFKAHPAGVVKEVPFVPKKTPTVVIQRPYNLRSDQRLAERKKYDEAVQRAVEEKKKKEEAEQKRLAEERYKELRKATTFKARPNPFK